MVLGAGRAVVELVIEKEDGSLSYVTDAGGGSQQQARLLIKTPLLQSTVRVLATQWSTT